MQQHLYTNFDRLRLPLIILIVFIHARFTATELSAEASLYCVVSHYFSMVISQVAVPLFYFISGCLYFRDYEDFSGGMYLQKQKRRVQTLIIPYLIWNTLFWLLFSLFQFVIPSFVNGGIPNIVNATLRDVLWVFWGDSTGGPIDYPLWFIRDLIIVTFLSPLLYLLLFRNNIGYLVLLLLAFLWSSSMPVPFLGNNICISLFFFSLGGFLNSLLLNKVFLNTIKNKKLAGRVIIVFILLSVISIVNFYKWKDCIISLVSNKGVVLVGIPAMYCLVDRYHNLFDKCQKEGGISIDCVFFIFASHGFLITIIKRSIEKISIDSQIILTTLYLSIVFVTIAICIRMYRSIKIISPKLLFLLTGR